MKIALFTCYRPDVGGGGVNLRGLIPELSGCEVIWFFLDGTASPWRGSVWLGAPLIGGRWLMDTLRSPCLWIGLRHARVEEIVGRIVAEKADRHWVLAMNEGVLVGNRLADLAPAVPLHVSVQDDQEFGMFGRSKRYRWMARLTRTPFRRLMKRATSIDVTSDGMQRYYQQTLGVASVVVHPFVPALPAALPCPAGGGTLEVGHIGSVYSGATLAAFISALVAFARKRGRALRLIFIGQSRHLGGVRQNAPDAEVVFEPSLPEPQAVRRLMTCDFVYAMYPFDRASEVFSRTSLPTKLTTYLQAQRPIFAHAPQSSTLAALLREHPVGVVASGESSQVLADALEAMAVLSVPAARWAHLRDQVYGHGNVERLRSCFDRATQAAQRSSHG